MNKYSTFSRNHFSEKLQFYRLQNGMSQSELGRKIGVTPTTIWAYEAAERDPKCSTYADLADALGIDPIQFFVNDKTLSLLQSSEGYFSDDNSFLNGSRTEVISNVTKLLNGLSNEELLAIQVILASMTGRNR